MTGEDLHEQTEQPSEATVNVKKEDIQTGGFGKSVVVNGETIALCGELPKYDDLVEIKVIGSVKETFLGVVVS